MKSSRVSRIGMKAKSHFHIKSSRSQLRVEVQHTTTAGIMEVVSNPKRLASIYVSCCGLDAQSEQAVGSEIQLDKVF